MPTYSYIGLPSWLLIFAIGGAFIYIIERRRLNRYGGPRMPYPPGPKGRFFTGNMSDLPSKANDQWNVVTKWGKEYGPVIHLEIMGQHLIFLNNYETAVDLFEKRSSVYSDRPQTPMIKLMNTNRTLPLVPYGDEFRLGRRIFQQGFNFKSSLQYREIQTNYSRKVLRLLHRDPESCEEQIKFFASGVIIEATYGFTIESWHNPHVKKLEEGILALEGQVPGAFLVDTFPILEYVPAWMPGASFKRKAKLWRTAMEESYGVPFRTVVKSFEEGTAPPSFTSSWLSRLSQLSSENEKRRHSYILEAMAGSAFLAGFETTSATLMIFLLAMVQHPEAQRKAQQELDEIVGRERLPEFSDRDNLPFMCALLKEVQRWHPAVPLGVAHKAVMDGEYKGMRIPKGAVLMANAWGMSRDQAEYGSDVEAFRPERFLDSNARDPSKFIFGFGRRICPGRYFVLDSVFIVMCSILHVFRIGKVTNEDGTERPVKPEWRDNIVSHPLSFPCSFTVRFPGAEKLLE